MNEKVKVYLGSGAVVYFKGNENQLKAYVNSASARGGAVGDAFLDTEMKRPVKFAYKRVEYFHKI